MKYYEFITVPVTATTRSFLVGYNKAENEKVYNAGFGFDRFGDHDSYTAVLKGVEDESHIEFAPYLEWASGRPDRSYFAIVHVEIKKVLSQFRMPAHKWYTVNVIASKFFKADRESQAYTMLQLLSLRETLVDYPKSTFGLFPDQGKEPIKILETSFVTPENHQNLLNDGIESRQ